MPAANSLAFRIVETPAGAAAFVASDSGIRRTYLPDEPAETLRTLIRREFPAATEDATLLPAFATAIADYFAGRHAEFDVPLDAADAPPFHRAVWDACRAVGYGETTTYRDLAARVGRPGAARAVGNAMRTNRFPLVVPCHRVLRSDGGLGGFSGGDGVAFKQRLLDMERADAVC